MELMESSGERISMQVTVISFAHVALLELAVDVFLIGPVGGCQVFAYGDKGRCCHRKALCLIITQKPSGA